MMKKLTTIALSCIILYWVSCNFTSQSSRRGLIVRKHPQISDIQPSSKEFYSEVIAGLKEKKITLITNPSGIGRNPGKIKEHLQKYSISLEFLIGLEHGFLGIEEDFSHRARDIDAIFSVPIYHIYKIKKSRLKQLLAPLDAVVFDVQDVGMRCYTYVTVLKRVMDVLAPKTRLIVLDHINPGIHFPPRGQKMDQQLFNFAGEFPSLFISGLTIGESASYYNHAHLNSRVNLSIIPVKNYRREITYEESGIGWDTPSPNLPTLDSARNYYSLVLLEGVNVSVGRGTQAPFVYFGAPWMTKPDKLAETLNRTSNREYYYRVVYFKPDFGPYKGKICQGLRLTIVDINYDPIRAGYLLIQAIKATYPKHFRWRGGGKRYWLDLLWGTADFRRAIDKDQTYWQFYSTFSNGEQEMLKIVKRYRIY